MDTKLDNLFFENIRLLLRKAQDTLLKQVNSVMVYTYFELGKQIVEQEQKGKSYADYGTFILSELSERLTIEFGKGYSKETLS